MEQLAKAFGVDIATLLGFESREQPTEALPKFPREQLEALARQFRAAADALVELLGGTPVSVGVPSTNALVTDRVIKHPDAHQAARDEASPWPWAKIMPVAERLLREKPSKKWKPTELCQAIRSGGVKLKTIRGMHFGILPRLQRAGLIVEKANGTFTANTRVLGQQPDPPRASEILTRPTIRQAVVKRVSRQAASRGASGIESLVAAGRSVLAANPSRVWKAKELVHAVRATGVKLRTWRGVQLYLIKRLHDENLIEANRDGTLTRRAQQVKSTVARVAARRPKSAAAPASSTEEKFATIDQLRSASQSIMEKDPARLWKAKEFVQAVRATGARLRTWRGVHLYLIKHLKDKGLIETRGDGLLSATGGASPLKPPDQSAVRKREHLAERESRETADQAVSKQDPAILALANEIEALAPRLVGMTPRERTAQLAVWAGRARLVQEELAERTGAAMTRKGSPLRPVFKRLFDLRQSLDGGWIDALSPAWATDWKSYIEINRAISTSDTPSLSVDQKKLYFQDVLRSLLEIRRKKGAPDAPALIIEASQVLDETDPWLVDAIETFGKHVDRRSEATSLTEPFRRGEDASARLALANTTARKQGIPKSVLKATRGKRLLIAGGSGSHETQRLAVKRGLQFKEVDWITGERNPNPIELFSLAVRNKMYDVVLLMAGTAPAETSGLRAACKAVGASLFYLSGSPSIPSVAEAIFAHHVVGGRVPEWMQTE